VLVRAQDTPAVAGATVHFRAFDVDEPSDDDWQGEHDKLTIDSKGDLGDDNYGGSGCSLQQPSAVTDASMAAAVVFETNMRPSDNFRVTASCRRAELKKLHVLNPHGQFLRASL